MYNPKETVFTFKMICCIDTVNSQRTGISEIIPCLERGGAMTQRIRLILADDHRIFRKGLKSLLSEKDYIQVLAEADDGDQALEMARKYKPRIVLMDMTEIRPWRWPGNTNHESFLWISACPRWTE